MTAKRIVELRAAGSPIEAARFRPSFAAYSERRLLTMFAIYAAATLATFVWFSFEKQPLLLASLPLWIVAVGVLFRFIRDPSIDPELADRFPSRPSIAASIGMASIVSAVLLIL